MGLHARAAVKFVNLANRFGASVKIIKDGDEIDGKSILGILTLAATQGTTIRLVIVGKDEEAAMSALAELIANRFDEKSDRMDMTRLRGIGVSAGDRRWARSSWPKRVVFTSRKEIIADDQVPDEIKRLHQALDRTRDDLARVKESVREKMGSDSSLIFEAHLLILEDPTLVGSLEAVIRDEKARAEWALSKANARYEKLFESLTDDYFGREIPLPPTTEARLPEPSNEAGEGESAAEAAYPCRPTRAPCCPRPPFAPAKS